MIEPPILMDLPLPATPPRAVLDTDTYNEVDDQFALAHLLLSPAQVRLEAVYAAPFDNPRSSGPADGMEKSFEEIHRVMDVTSVDSRPPVYRGATRFMAGAGKPVESEAVTHLIERALEPNPDKLHILAIAAATNVASALLLEPKIADRIVIVWLGGNAPYWPDAQEFNLQQDPHAARVLFETRAPLVYLPCLPVVSHLVTTVAEIEEEMAPYSKLGRYLADIVRGYNSSNTPAWSKVIWDIVASAWLMNPAWAPTYEAPSPVLNDDLTWGVPAPDRHHIRIARSVDRDGILGDFFAKARHRQ